MRRASSESGSHLPHVRQRSRYAPNLIRTGVVDVLVRTNGRRSTASHRSLSIILFTRLRASSPRRLARPSLPRPQPVSYRAAYGEQTDGSTIPRCNSRVGTKISDFCAPPLPIRTKPNSRPLKNQDKLFLIMTLIKKTKTFCFYQKKTYFCIYTDQKNIKI